MHRNSEGGFSENEQGKVLKNVFRNIVLTTSTNNV